jgi:hypothetical protein
MCVYQRIVAEGRVDFWMKCNCECVSKVRFQEVIMHSAHVFGYFDIQSSREVDPIYFPLTQTA